MSRAVTLKTLLLFAAWTLLFGVLASWLLQHNYANQAAVMSWAWITGISDAESLRLENLGFTHPHGAMLILAPLHYLPFVGTAAPFVASVLVLALLMSLWQHHLKQGGYNGLQRILLLLALLLNPAILWGATSGGSEALALLMFYLLYRSCLRMVYEKDIRSFIALGLVLALFFYFDVISVFLFIALLPLLILIVPIPMLRKAPLSVYIIVGMPLLIMLVAWIYFNWIFLGDPLAFIKSYESAFAGARNYAETLPWLREYGGQFFRPLLIALVYVVVGYPVILFLMMQKAREREALRVSLVLMLHPVIAVAVATMSYFLASPLQITFLIAAGVMAEIGRLAYNKAGKFVPMLALLLLGVATNWLLFLHGDNTHVRPWTAALVGQQEVAHPGDVALGKWLALHRLPTLLDLHSSYRVIAARGDARGLILPFTAEYRLAMRSQWPYTTQIAVPDPATPSGSRDAINTRFPQLYDTGVPGYERVYDEQGWRVYRRRS